MTKTNGPRPAVIINEILVKQVATYFLANPAATISGAAKALSMDRTLVKKITERTEFRELLEKVASQELVPVLARARSKLGKLVDKAIKVVEDALDDGSLQAAAMVLKSIGLEDPKDNTGDTNINVIMPGGAKPEKSVDAEVINIEGIE